MVLQRSDGETGHHNRFSGLDRRGARHGMVHLLLLLLLVQNSHGLVTVTETSKGDFIHF